MIEDGSCDAGRRNDEEICRCVIEKADSVAIKVYCRDLGNCQKNEGECDTVSGCREGSWCDIQKRPTPTSWSESIPSREIR